MASINDLGRNSAAITYGPFVAGQDTWPTFALVDQWLRQDTWVGTATASGTTVTGTGTIWTTQARAGDTILIAGQYRTIASVATDTSLTVTVAFSPAISLQSAVKVISLSTYNNVGNNSNTTATGSAVQFVRNNTNGVVSVTNGSNTITGVGTFFLAECTNSVSQVSVAGTVAVDAYGNITGTGTSFTTAQGAQNGLYPGDCISVTYLGGQYYMQIATVTSDTAATTLYPPAFPLGITSITGGTLTKATNNITGRTININGRIRTVTAIQSNTSMTVNFPMDFTDSNLHYKVYPRGTVANAVSGTLNQSAGVTISSTTMTVANAPTAGTYISIGAGVAGTNITGGTTVTNQLYGASGSAAATTTASGTISTNTITVASATSILVGHLLAGTSGTVATGVAASTYVTSISGTTLTLSQNLTATLSSANVSFYPPGGTGVYTVSQSSTATSVTAQFSGIIGTNTNFAWDIGSGDQVWIGDELRTFYWNNSLQPALSLSSGSLNTRPDVIGYTQDYAGYSGVGIHVLRQTLSGTNLPQYRREDSYINGLSTSFATDLRVGDDIIVDGSEWTVQLITAANQIKVSGDVTHTLQLGTITAGVPSTTYLQGSGTTLAATPAAGTFAATVTSASGLVVGQYATGPGIPIGTYINAINGSVLTLSQAFYAAGNTSSTYQFYNGPTIYKKKKIHGNVLEGSREGFAVSSATPVGKFSGSSTLVTSAGANTAYLGASTMSLAASFNITNNIVKIAGAGGTPYPLTGQINTVSASATITGTNTTFTTQLHVGAELIIANQHVYVAAIANDTTFTANATMTVTGPTPYYRSVPLYTYVSAGGGTGLITLGTPVRNAAYSTGANPALVYWPGNAGDFLEYVYSAPNVSAETTSTLSNQSPDRKYFGFRYFPLNTTTFTAPANSAFSAFSSAHLGAYSMPVYERWSAAWGQSNGVGINLADSSGGVAFIGTQTTTSLTLTTPISGQVQMGMNIGAVNAATGTQNNITAVAGGTLTLAGSTYTMSLSASPTTAAGAVIWGGLGNACDIVPMTHGSGGFIYMFGSSRYTIFQGKSFNNVQTQWIGCVEFERAQPEDAGTGLGTTAGVTYTTFGGTTISAGSPAVPMYPISPVEGALQLTPAVAPWPCYAYINGNRFPVGAQSIPLLPVAQSFAVHGNIFAVPRVRNSAGDLVGINAHVYSAATITTGRWGHLFELGGDGSYNALPNASLTSGTIATNANRTLIPHLGQIVPVYTNVYNSKRFMFSPVVVLGPSYDPDIRGRFYGLKVIPNALGTLMDTVSITVDNTWFYNVSSGALDHWVLTTPPAGNYTNTVTTYRLQPASAVIQQSYRSLEDTGSQAINSAYVFTNNFRWAVPA
jgi:hypothetical protein